MTSPTDPPAAQPEIETPCIGTCQMNPRNDLCFGCLRTMEEIVAWGSMSPEARREVLEQLPQRG